MPQTYTKFTFRTLMYPTGYENFINVPCGNHITIGVRHTKPIVMRYSNAVNKVYKKLYIYIYIYKSNLVYWPSHMHTMALVIFIR
jgi:hypothetical protein